MKKFFIEFVIINFVFIFLASPIFHFKNYSAVQAQIFSATSSQTIKIQIIRPDLPQCSNGLDDDLDGKIDFPEDLGCSNEDDNNETSVVSPPPGGGGGGGDYVSPTTNIIFEGRAFPKSSVTLLKDAQVVATTVAGSDANFKISISGLSGGNYIFSVYGEDSKGVRSSLLTFPVSVTFGAITKVSGIFVAPTIAVDKSEVRRGDNIVVLGQSAPQADIIVSINSEEEFFGKTVSDKNGIYLYNFDTSIISYGDHSAKSKAALNGDISSYSKAIGFKVGTKNVFAKSVKCPPKADLNNDCRVNLVDFSIVAYWYKKPLSSVFKSLEVEKLNGDGKINLIDFSIMAYYWTG